jgi:hypothetical protein
MTTRRSLADSVAGLAHDLTPRPLAGLRVTRLEAEVPFEMVIGGLRERGEPGGLDVRGDIPTWRWRTAFDRPPGRLTVRFVETAVPTGGAA